MIRRYALATALVLTLTQAGCPSDPYDPHTWIDKLDDPDTQVVNQAVIELQRLKDPVAITALGKTWDKQNRPSNVLRVIIELSAREENDGPHWEDALPVLETAVAELDEGDSRAIENAIIAADALGQARDKSTIPTLIKAANRVMPNLSKGQRARLAAIRALGKFGNEPTTVNAIIKVLEADIEDQPWNLFAAAAQALSDAASPKAMDPLLATFYKIPHPIVSRWCMVALVAIGKPVIPEAIKIFEGEHQAINKIAREQKFNVECDRGYGPDTTCRAPSNLEYKAAQLLGHLRAEQAVDELVAGLKKPELPAFFIPQGEAPTQHAAILDALKRIGKPSAAGAVLAYALDSKTADAIRPLAIDTYSYLTTDTDALSALAKMIKDEDAEEPVRLAAGITYGRLTRSADSYDPLTYMIDRFRKEANKNDGKAKRAEAAYEKANKAHEAAQKKASADPQNKKLEKAAEKAKEKMEEAYRSSRLASNQVAGYRRFQRTFEQNLARAHVGVKCKKDPACYVKMLDIDPEALGKELKSHLDDWKDWTTDDKAALAAAAMDRSLLELAKMGEGARSVFDAILDKVESTDRIMRQGTLIVMMQTAQLPCKKCVERLDEIIEKQEEQTTLQQLTYETQMVRHYFSWAGI